MMRKLRKNDEPRTANNNLLGKVRGNRQVWLPVALGLGALFSLGTATNAQSTPTAAGTNISNTATATYTDPNNPNAPLTSTSNKVTIVVAEVAGITVTPQAITDTKPGAQSVLPGDVLNYDFKVTNTGNDPTTFQLPSTANLTGPGTQGTLTYSTDGGVTFIALPPGGTTASIPAGGSVIVRVPVTVNANALSGTPLKVVLGNTTPDGSGSTQNQPYNSGGPAGPNPNDVKTTDNADGVPGETAGPPVNGEREASATQQILIGASPQAFAEILKDHGTPVIPDSTKPLNAIIPYSLSVQVDATPPPGASASYIPADLAPSNVTIDGSIVAKILVSDAIPANTVLTSAPTAPANWAVVYSVLPAAGTIANGGTAGWTVTQPANLATVTRIGYIYNGSGNIKAGTLITGFGFSLTTTATTSTGSLTIANIAQLFGTTAGDPGGPAGKLVYDESGDHSPSNFNDDGSPNSTAPSNGVANPANDGTDPGNNRGVGPGGEDNITTLGQVATILNGPSNAPSAVGPTDNNDDFTNQSSPVPANTPPGSTIDPAAVTFTNTINNPSNSSPLTNVLVAPSPPAVKTDIPDATTATITFNGKTAVYTYNQILGTWAFTSGQALPTIASLPPGQSVSYTVVVDLPAGTPLSTDTGKGFPVSIIAFQDSNGDGQPTPGEASNITIDRIYTGFLKLLKEVRIYDTNGTTVLQDWTQANISGAAPGLARPGRFIEYRITYTNISSAPAGNGDILLNADKVVITEDGLGLNGNNWALDQDSNGVIDTSNVLGSAVDSGGAPVTFFNGAPATLGADQTGTVAASDVTKYVVNVNGLVVPQQARFLTFRRKIN